MHYINKTILAIFTIIVALICLGCALTPAFANSYPYTYSGIVTYIYDGDTVAIRDHQGQEHCVRLASIDAPEKNQPYSQEATKLLKQLLLLHKVTVTVRDLDPYNRQVAHVYYNNGTNLSHTLLERGAAWHFGYFDRENTHYKLHKQLQENAKKEKLGLWAIDKPVKPCKWRAQHQK